MSYCKKFAMHVLMGGSIAGCMAIIASSLVTREAELSLLCTGALIWGLVGAAVGAILSLLLLAQAR